MTPIVRYRAGYRFQLAEAIQVQTPISGEEAGNEYVHLSNDGVLTIQAGYARDGASGPIQQTPDIIRGSLVHDALYQLMRECGLSTNWRYTADEMLRQICVDDGMPGWLASVVFLAVRNFGGHAIDPLTTRPVLVAPIPVSYPSSSELTAP